MSEGNLAAWCGVSRGRMSELSAKREAFAREYLQDRCATKAAVRAGYSAKTARVQGPRLLLNVAVRARVMELIAAQMKRLGITNDRVYDEIEAIGFSNMSDFATWGPDGVALFPSDEMPREGMACIAEVSQTRTQFGGTIRIKLHDKLEALALVAKLKGMADEGVSDEERARSIRAHLEELEKATFVDPPEEE